MKLPKHSCCLSVLIFLGTLCLATADSLDDALALIKCTRSDLAIPTDIRWRDPFRLEVIDHLLAHPLDTPDLCQTMAEEFANADSLEAMIALAGQRLEFRTSNTERPASNE